jgi:hypothetical protein
VCGAPFQRRIQQALETPRSFETPPLAALGMRASVEWMRIGRDF